MKDEEEIKVRVNTYSKNVAIATKALLEKRFRRKFDFAISTRNLIMLDCDRKNALRPFLVFCSGVCKRFAGRGIIYETPHGYHFILLKYLRWPRIKQFLIMLANYIKKENINWIDLAHIEASLRRGYITLRLCQRRRLCIIEEDGSVKWLIPENEVRKLLWR